MNRNFTPLTLSEISTTKIDLIADAFGYEYAWSDIICLLDICEIEPEEKLVKSLLSKI
jgi:hypothetical protein